jgi:NADH-quinone oxidoreductase subunit F
VKGNNGREIKILVCQGTSGIAAGAREVFSCFERELNEHKIAERCSLIKTGDRGLYKDVLVDVIMPEQGCITYDTIMAEHVHQIVEEHIVGGKPVKKLMAGDYYKDFFSGQRRLVLRNCGEIDPEDIDSYIARDGFNALRKAVEKMSPEEVIEEVKKSGLRGRGGGGFPTGRKWEECRRYRCFPKYTICNGDEGDPGAFMDRAILEGDPYAVIEGMILSAYAIGGVQSGYIYVRAEYPLAVERLTIALQRCREKGFLGKGILGADLTFDIQIKMGAGAFVCGESTALMYSIEGKRGMPRIKPPRSVESGLWMNPTNLNNVETFANVPRIILNGADWFTSVGTEGSKGTKVFALTGKVKNTGLVEVPMGTTIRELVFGPGGGMIRKNIEFKAAQLGGPSGGCLPAELLDTPIDFDSLTSAGSMMGSGGMVIMDQSTCMVDLARFFLNFSINESCGKCVPCRMGLKVMLNVLDRIIIGGGEEDDVDFLIELGNDIKATAHCGLGNTAPNPVLSTLRYFREEYESHIMKRECPAHICTHLLKFEVDEERCTQCGRCAQACPVEAIAWEKKTYPVIDRERCVKCKSCITACGFMAIG